METPLVNDAARLRADLWERLGAVRAGAGFSCAQPAVACGEVELVHAGNEFNQQQWRHAKPYIQMAEDLVADAELLAAGCAVPPPAPAAAPAQASRVATVLFAFDRSGRGDIEPASLQALEALLRDIAARGDAIGGVELVGHADRLDGNAGDYNMRLSRARADTIGEWLAERGVAPGLIAYRYLGDAEQVVPCDGVEPGDALRRCLLPNRRVEVRITTVADVD